MDDREFLIAQATMSSRIARDQIIAPQVERSLSVNGLGCAASTFDCIRVDHPIRDLTTPQQPRRMSHFLRQLVSMKLARDNGFERLC